MKQVTILGAGITGLTLAYLLQKKAHVTLIEKSPRIGGWIRTVNKEDFLTELGPRGFRPKGEGKWTYHLAQELKLPLIPADKSATKRYVVNKKTLEVFGFKYLMAHGLFSTLWKDLRCVPKKALSDESIADFFARHLHPKLVSGLIDPLVKGIFGGDPHTLSAQSCFPGIVEWESTYGSLIKGAFKQKKSPEKLAPLFSFKNGMQQLPEGLLNHFNGELILSTTASKEHLNRDLVISTLPPHELSLLLGIPSPHTEAKTLSLVSLGWDQQVLPRKGFGFLAPSRENLPFLGMTWDSSIFPQQNKGPQTRCCVMISGNQSKEQLMKSALFACQVAKISKEPTHFYPYIANRAIPQFQVGHKQALDEWKRSLPSHIYAAGSWIEGKGVNGCVKQAYTLFERLSPIL